ncbi:sensor histidine kinase [Calditrichota bacterium]
MLNMIAFNLIYVPAFFMLVVFPYLGYMTQFYATASFSIGVIIFYIGILRYQFSQVEELNIGLEKKVLQRTEALKQAHTRMVQSEKMASLGQLVAGIAHEINNPVGAIRSMQQNLSISVDKLKNVLKDVPDKISGNDNYQLSMKVIDEANRVIDDGSKRVADIVSQLKSFARLDEAELQEIDIHGGIDDTLALLHHELKHCEEIKKDYADLPRIPCYPGKLNQVWLNLLVNAKQSFYDGCGKIKISTGNSNGNIYVKIEDNGEGIPDENLRQIFDPGFTSKGVGVGTGLGLAICYQIIQDHNGEIKVESREGEGTVFTVFLPEQQSAGDLDSIKSNN